MSRRSPHRGREVFLDAELKQSSWSVNPMTYFLGILWGLGAFVADQQVWRLKAMCPLLVQAPSPLSCCWHLFPAVLWGVWLEGCAGRLGFFRGSGCWWARGGERAGWARGNHCPFPDIGGEAVYLVPQILFRGPVPLPLPSRKKRRTRRCLSYRTGVHSHAVNFPFHVDLKKHKKERGFCSWLGSSCWPKKQPVLNHGPFFTLWVLVILWGRAW